MKIGSLCSGYGGLDRAVEAFYGATPAWFCEFAAGPSKILAHHYPDVPNHHDLTQTDWATVEPVDIVTAGWPCQPWSLNGRQKGAADERAIWPAIAGAVRVLRPRIVVLENVSAILIRGELARAIGNLAELGYVGSWVRLRASDVGFCHARSRVFIVATDTQGERLEDYRLPSRKGAQLPSINRCGPLLPTPSASDSTGGGTNPGNRRAGGHTVQLIDAVKDADFEKYGPAIRRQESVTRTAPSPVVLNSKGRPQLNVAFDEWMMGLPAGWITSVPTISRSDQIKVLGNGVIPQQAYAALCDLQALECAA